MPLWDRKPIPEPTDPPVFRKDVQALVRREFLFNLNRKIETLTEFKLSSPAFDDKIEELVEAKVKERVDELLKSVQSGIVETIILKLFANRVSPPLERSE